MKAEKVDTMDLTSGLIAEFHVATARADLLVDSERLSSVATAIIRAADVVALGPPLLASVPIEPDLVGTPDDDGGLTLLQPLTTSHLAIHTWPAQGRARVVLDVCVPFEVERIARLLENALEAHVVARSREYRDLMFPEVHA